MTATVRPWLADPAWQRTLREQLDEEMERLRLLLRRHIDWLRHRSGRWPLSGTGAGVITDSQVLSGLAGVDQAQRAEFNRASEHNRNIRSLEGSLEARSTAMAASGTPFPLDELAIAFGLSQFVQDTLTLALAPDLDPAMPRLLAYAQDDAAARLPTPGLALELFDSASRAAHPTAAPTSFGPDGPFARLALLRPAPDHTGGDATRPLRLEPRVGWFMQGIDDTRAAPGWSLLRLEPAPIPAEFGAAADQVAAALDRAPAGARPALVNLVGPNERSARALAVAIAARTGLGLHILGLDSTLAHVDLANVIACLDRELVLRRTAYLVEAGDDDLGLAADVAERCAALILVSSHHPVRVSRPVVTVSVGQPAPASRRVLWAQALGPIPAEVEDALPEIIHHFDLDPEAIARVAATAQGQARLRGERISRRDLWQACRAFGRRRLGGLAERIDADFGWDDIVLAAAARVQLEEISAQVRHRATVYEDWQFARRLPRGRGVTALFAGPSGTGKTMAAEVLARELDLDLYRIDLAGVVNKYIGETEKNLRRIFAAAEESGAILFFDEADALFGKRTDVRDSHDRYANIEIDYLLQRMEAYTGLAILATNRKAALDRAFLRRLRFLVDFPFPAADLRLRIWQKVLPASAPTRGIDFGALSQLDLAGGSIQSVALNAAFLAAADGRVITMDHLTHAASREYAKLDKIATDADFSGLVSAAAS